MARFSPAPDTFVVEEIPAYRPQGSGPHTYLWIEKRDLTTPEAVRRLARALGAPERELGYAGMKDRHATTRQWISVPAVDPEAARAVRLVDEAQGGALTVLDAERHGNKLRVGHLRGNRFEVVLTEVGDDEVAPLRDGLLALAARGLPNRYGHQRFGAADDNVRRGREILTGERRERDHRKRRLLLSAVQSAVFNRVLELRAAEGDLLRVRAGDVLQKRATGGLFVAEDLSAEQARVDAGEVTPTAPLPGGREIEPPEGTAARVLEDQALAEVAVTREQLAAAGRDLPGARRPVVVPVTLDEPPVVVESGGLRLRFSLPAGSYATVLLEALAAGLPPGKAVLTFPARTRE